MKSIRMRSKLFYFFLFFSVAIHAIISDFTLQEAEQLAIQNSNKLKAASFDIEVSKEQENAGFAILFPKLSLQANYTYLSTLPSFKDTPFGDHNNYSLGPMLSYTLWDTLSSFKSLEALEKLKASKQQDHAATKQQILLAVRSAYIRVQLALEELRLVSNSLELARTQQHDIQNRFKAGSATSLDKLISNRQVLEFELQLKQKQADLSVSLKDLETLTGNTNTQLESLSTTLTNLNALELSAPTEEQPQIKSLKLLSESLNKAASAQTAKLFPTLQLFASTMLAYPNGPVLDQINQNTVGFSLSLPLYVGDPTWHTAASKRQEALAAKHRALQLQTDLNRDFEKAQKMLESLREQKQLATLDISQSSEVAQLYYNSYKAGKSNLIDVQSANHQALQSRVNAARIDAQILNQLILLHALSGGKNS